jgi:glucose uptake protein GlcU
VPQSAASLHYMLMKEWKKMFRMAGIIVLILFASTGLLAGALMLPRNREKFMNKEITTEQVEKDKTRSDGELKLE